MFISSELKINISSCQNINMARVQSGKIIAHVGLNRIWTIKTVRFIIMPILLSNIRSEKQISIMSGKILLEAGKDICKFSKKKFYLYNIAKIIKRSRKVAN